MEPFQSEGWRAAMASVRHEIVRAWKTDAWPLSIAEVARLQSVLQANAKANVELLIRDDPDGPAIIVRLMRRERAPQGAIVLSPRERQVARLVAEGLTNRQIAVQLQLSSATVKDHVQSILKRTGARRRVQLAALLAREAIGMDEQI